MTVNRSIGDRLEQYTIKRPQEVLMVNARIGGDKDQIAIFKGFSSSLMRPTAFDPDIPVLPDDAEIISIDRLKGPLNPDAPSYIQRGLTWQMMSSLLEEVGV
jgi:hypothetical protein